MHPLDLVKLPALMARARGSHEVKIGLIDGPVATQHPDLAAMPFQEIPGNSRIACRQASSVACLHGTFIAGILSAKRGSAAPAICPGCPLLIRPIFTETAIGREHLPSAAPSELAAAIIECVDAGARVINLSLALAQPSGKAEQALKEALDWAVRRGVIVVAAAGNQGVVGSTAITSHPWVVPVAACDRSGRPMNASNLGGTIGRQGLSAPGDGITSLGTDGHSLTLGGTSVAAPFVTGAIALLWSEFPAASAAQVKLAVTQAFLPRRASLVPSLLDAEAAYQSLLTMNARRRTA